MNALWLQRMCEYKSSPLAVDTASILVRMKIERQRILLRRYSLTIPMSEESPRTLQEVLLWEARCAKTFWNGFRALLPHYSDFLHRKPRDNDVVNYLLDIGYHHLTNVVKKVLDAHSIPTALAIFHVSHDADSTPLVYDLVELFRSDIVDAELLRFLRLKKKRIATVEQGEIAHFLHEVNERLAQPHYLEVFKQCHTYRYYIEIQIMKFIRAVNHHEIFAPIRLPTRHDSRCATFDNSQPHATVDLSKFFEIH